MAQLLGYALVAGGIGISAYSAFEEGKHEAKMGKLARDQYYAEAKSTEQAGQYESRQKRKDAIRTKASQVAQMAAQGGTLTGSNLLLLASTAKNFEDDAKVIMRNYQMSAIELRNRGKIALYEGQVARRAARMRGALHIIKPLAKMFTATSPKTTSAPVYSPASPTAYPNYSKSDFNYTSPYTYQGQPGRPTNLR